MFRWYEGSVGVSQVRALVLSLLLLASCLEKNKPRADASRATNSGSAAQSSARASDASAALPRVVFLGDSLSAGLHLPADQAFPALLHARLARAGEPFTLVNAGVSGDTTAGGLRRVDWLLKQNPSLVVLELGANDGLRGLGVEHIEDNLRKLIAKIRAQGAKVLLLGMRVPPSYGAEYAERFAAVYPRLAEELKVRWVPFFLQDVVGHPELMLPDGLHPNQKGQERIAAALEQPLREALQAARSTEP